MVSSTSRPCFCALLFLAHRNVGDRDRIGPTDDGRTNFEFAFCCRALPRHSELDVVVSLKFGYRPLLY